jgi:nitrate reductase NapD
MRLHRSILDRRAFISGRLANADPLIAPPGAEIASALVQARPDRLAQVEEAIIAIPFCEVHGRDRRGKLVVVIDAPSAGQVGATLNQIALLPNVYSASLVFHAIDA